MTDPTYLTSLPLGAKALSEAQYASEKDPEKLKKTCADLESLFLYQLLKEMRATIPKSDLLGDRKTEEMYTSLLDMELSKEISSKKEIGIATMLYHQFAGQLEADDPKSDPSEDNNSE